MKNEGTLRNITLPAAIVCGLLFHGFLSRFYFMVPYLLFFMMFITCSKISMSDMKLRPIHGWLLSVQICVGIGLYYLLRGYDEIVAQGIMICVFTPVAIASPVVGGMLGADVTLMTTYVLLSNVSAAVIAPLFFSLSGNADAGFWSGFLYMLRRTALLLILPLLISWFLDHFVKPAHAFIKSHQSWSFYLWAVCMMIMLGSTIHSIFESDGPGHTQEIVMAAGALVLCLVQFSCGAALGTHYGDKPAGRQMLGQKNTGVGIWLTISFLNPLASVGPACYIIWQNLLNSYEIWRHSRKK